MSVTGSIFFDEICRRGSIHAADVQKLRALYYEDGRIAAQEADALFTVNDSCSVKDPDWKDFFVEAIADFIVGHAEPRGYINTHNADWLIERITADGQIETQTELEILVRTMDKARWSPESFVKFALNTVKDAVISGNASVRGGHNLRAGVVTDADVELLRRIIFAFGGDGHVAVTRAEAEILFEINDATAEATDNPAWTEFFVKAVSGVVMAASGYRPPTREAAIKREVWLESRGDLSPANVLSKMSSAGAGGMTDQFSKGVMAGFFALFSPQDAEERELARLEQERRVILTSEEVTGDEARWLVDQINRDGELTYNEKCLLANLKAESPKLDPILEPLLERVADTA